MVADRAGYANPAGLGDPLQSGGDIHAVAVDVVVFGNHNVAEIDSDPEYDPLIIRSRDVALGHPALHRNRTGDGLNDARELDQDAIAGGLDDAAPVFCNIRIDQFAAVTLKPGKSPSLVPAHKAAVTDDIGGENGRKPAFYPLSTQGFLPGAWAAKR
jgi:hypothetical protein